MEAHRDIFANEDAPKAIFSVGPMDGFRTYNDYKYDLQSVDWDEPARAYDEPDRQLENVRLRMKRDDFWGGAFSRTHISPAMTNPSWKDVLDFANEGIVVTNDWHHIFLESISFSGDHDELGREFVDLWLGS